MPLKTITREGSPYYYVRGSIRGKPFFRSTGETEYAAADEIRIKWEVKYAVEKKRLPEEEATVTEAIIAYIEQGGEKRFVEKIADYIGHYPLSAITQEFLDKTAFQMYPKIKPVSRRRQFYDPMIAIMKVAAKRDMCPYKIFEKPKFKRPPAKYAELDWFKEFWAECKKQKEDDLLAITTLLPYTGLRISEALRIRWSNIDVKHQSVYIEKTKNQEARTAYLPDHVLKELMNIKRGDGAVFRFKDRTAVNRAIKRVLRAVNEKRKDRGLDPLPYLSTHKIGSHTYATWMRKYAGLDHAGLVATGRWKHHSSTFIYTHAKVSEESRKSDLLPRIGRAQRSAGKDK